VKVYEAINAVQSALAKEGIGKTRENAQQHYKFRGIDEVYNALAPILATSKLCILPRVLSREMTERQAKSGGTLFCTVLDVEYDFVHAEDGSKHTVRVVGEAMDSADKSSNKSMSAAYKYACIQAFCIPTEGDNDADGQTPEVAAQESAPAQERQQATAHAPRTVRPGALRVTNAKIAKEGSNAKGKWTLYAIKFSDGREATTFSKSIFLAAEALKASGNEADAVIEDGERGSKNLLHLTAVRQLQEELEEAPF
jgi:hypothetical protein